jgi:Helitron helicase-like domain at N-terminus
MITLSPSSHNQFHLAIRAGLQTVSSIEDALIGGDELPSISTIREFASKDPVVAAEYFDEISHFFFEHILGWDITKCCPIARGGLFGTTLAFAGGIETQGCGLLHWHILLWISEMPSTLEAELACKGYEELLRSYIDSLITTSIPIITLFQTIIDEKVDSSVEEEVVAGVIRDALQEGTLPLSSEEMNKERNLSATTWCPYCGPKEFLVPNSIPAIQMTNHASFAPIIASCTRCKSRFSHISLRKAFMNLASSLCGYDTKAAQHDAILALAAPTALLPPPLLSDEGRLQLACEVQQFFLTQEGHRSISSAATDQADTSTQHDQEPYKTCLPGEIAMHVRQMMVYTCAIVQTQEHKFAHHGSCFKKGLQTGCKHLYCRYAFPKPSQCSTIVLRSGATTEDVASDEVSLRRPLGSEYLNGYMIPVLALTKANADCTVLRNKNVSYCTKYTTKAQDTVDSCAVVNKYIASIKKSFENRQKVEEANPSLTDDLLARGRLFSLTWQYTNMQEIANTMASLYILRNAPPMYQSHECVPLILSSGLSMLDGKTEVETIKT